MTFKFRLEGLDGEPFDPPTYATSVHRWSTGDRIPIGLTGRSRWLVFATTTPTRCRSWSLRTRPDRPLALVARERHVEGLLGVRPRSRECVEALGRKTTREPGRRARLPLSRVRASRSRVTR
jgi:hypothetical protein